MHRIVNCRLLKYATIDSSIVILSINFRYHQDNSTIRLVCKLIVFIIHDKLTVIISIKKGMELWHIN